MNKTVFVLCTLVIILLASCQTVKPYQRAYLNDRDMYFGTTTVEMVEVKTHAYREGAAGAGKGKTSGGCGCR